MAECNMVASVGTINDIKNSMLQRPTSLTVAQPSSPPPSGVVKNTEHIKTPSPLKHLSGTTIIQIPPSPNQKLPLTSPISQDASTAGTNVPQATSSFSFMEMASSFFRWGGKGGSSATATTSQTEIVTSKIEASPKSTTVDVEGPVAEQPLKSIKTSNDRAGSGPIINVITNPNENIKLVNAPVTSSVTVSAVSGKQRTSRKTMRAPQPPIAGTPKLDSRLANQESTQHSSPDAADVQEKTEEKLLKLLSDFNSGKFKAFSEDGRERGPSMMAHMEDIRDQQQGLGKLHFELSGAGIGVVPDGTKQPAPLSKERLSIANDNMNRLMTHLEKLSLAIENLSPATKSADNLSSHDNEKRL